MGQEIDLNSLWQSILPYLEKGLNKPLYETIAYSTRPLSLENETLVLSVPNAFSQDWLYEKKCDITIISALASVGKTDVRTIRFIIAHKDDQEDVIIEEKRTPIVAESSISSTPFLNGRYVFNNFVVGYGNRFAHAASLAVSEAPGKAYNPLFLYGGVGLGKTHLMQAIGHAILKTFPKLKVVYVTSEKFTNEVIDSIRYDKMAAFREKYRSVDLLMIDDIQFIAGKERTQEEFFHTFNTLYESSKQIIISNDRPPKEIVDLEERLRSRFEWGLIADIQPPDFETRIAILKKKAELEEILVPDDVFSFIATKISSNIRELEGALIRVIAHGAIENQEITIESAEKILKDLLSPAKGKPPITIDLIKKTTAEFYSIKIDLMSAKTRIKEVATARQIAMYIARELTNASLPRIGEAFGGRDHTTVIHACEKIKACLDADEDIKTAVNSIISKIKSL